MSPISTNLDRDPYWEDFNTNDNYYGILFQPGVSVQTRELNNLQAMFQAQIEAFGDNIFSTGTIVSGCNFQFYNPYPYVQLNDVDIFNNVVIPINIVGLNVLNQTTGMSATVVNYANGFQTTPPNLKTIYIKYNNIGNTGANLTSFSAGDTLIVYNPVTQPVNSVTPVNGGIAFSNTDLLLAISPVICTVTAGTPTVGQYLNNGNGLTNVQIVTVTSLQANQYVIVFQPRSVDLANSQANSQYWTFAVNDTLTNPTLTLTMTVNQLVGAGLQGNIITNSVGTIISCPLTNGGVGYIYNPFMTVQSFNNSTGYNTLNLQAQNYLTQVVVASGANTVGNGYAFGITEGVIYQKGYFVGVVPQQILVSNFNQLPDNVAVGFITNEEIVTFNIDPSLVDNANGQQNFQAPGADRLKLVPQLQLTTIADATANQQFLSLVQWNNGQPFLQKQQTIYSTIEAEMAQRTNDADGDFVIDPFVVTTTSPFQANQEGEFFNVVIDPGTAYINGFKVQTVANFNTNDEKGTDSRVVNSHTISLNYGNYFIVNNVAGVWNFNIGDSVSLYDAAKTFYSAIANPLPNITPTGNLIGTANIRSMIKNGGEPGVAGTTYNLYVFNISMNAGATVSNTKSIYSSAGGIADVVLTAANSALANIAVIQDSADDQLVFYAGAESLKNANNVIYTYRTVNTSLTTVNTGIITIDISSGSETFPYTANLSTTQAQDLYVVPTGADMVFTTGTTGTVNATTTNAYVVGTGTSFLTQLQAGDYVYVTANSGGGHDLKQVTGVVNNTYVVLNSNIAFANASAKLVRAFPNNVPIPFGSRTDCTANVNVNQNIMTLGFAQTFSFTGSTATTGAFNIIRTNNPSQISKTANRNMFVLLCTSNNAGGQTGPWCLGVPDAFRLRAVYVGNSSVSNTGTNWISQFYVNPRQNADFYNLSYLSLASGSTVPIDANTYFLVQFDYFTWSGVGYFDTVSYTHSSDGPTVFAQDSLPLANLTTFCNSFEVPEVFTDDGTEIDLLQYIDFRPAVANTVLPSATVGSAPLNPANTFSLSATGEKKFPLPGSNFIGNIETWEGRIDRIIVDQNGQFTIRAGTASANLSLAVPPVTPVGTLPLVDMVIPAYPDLPTNLGSNINQILNTRVVNNQRFKTTRIQNQTVYNLAANSNLPFDQPSVYTMKDIGNIDRRLQQVEYYVSLNTLESNTALMLIPSSVNPSLNRTAYGIFTDDFTTSAFSAISDPEYAALKQGTNIVPTKMLWDLSFAGTGTNYIEFPIIQQGAATVGGITDPLGLGPVCALNLANTVAYTMVFRNATDILTSANPNATVDNLNITMADVATVTGTFQETLTLSQWLTTHNYNAFTSASLTDPAEQNPLGNFAAKFGGIGGYNYNSQTQTLTIISAGHIVNGVPVTFAIKGINQQLAQNFIKALLGQITWQAFFGSLNINNNIPSGGTFVAQQYNPPVAFYFYNYDQGVRYDIYQGTTLVASSDPTAGVPSCANLSADEIALLTSSAAQGWFNDNTQFFMQNFTNLSNGYVNYAGKILFNYNPANGSHFTLKTSMSATSYRWRWVCAYPIDGASVGCIPPVPTAADIGFTPTYTNYTYSFSCGNGVTGSGLVNILTGFTAIWSTPTAPQTVIVPFSSSADWA